MKGKVVLKFNGKTRIRLENGQELNLNNQQLRHFNPALKQGDTGEIYRLPDGSLKFRIDADDVELTAGTDAVSIEAANEKKSDA